jgi:hypothetical protein
MMTIDELIENYTAAVSTFALACAGEDDEVVERAADQLRERLIDAGDVRARTLVDAFIQSAMREKRSIELAASTMSATRH